MSRAELVLVVGPMFSGKTAHVVEALAAAEARGERTVAAKPVLDTRAPGRLVSRSGASHDAVDVRDAAELVPLVRGAALLGVDEVQFLADAAPALRRIADAGVAVVAAGLDLDFRGSPFPVVAEVAAAADRVVRLTGTCGRCGRPSTHSLRLVDDDATVLVGGEELYAPRCERCFREERGLRPGDRVA